MEESIKAELSKRLYQITSTANAHEWTALARLLRSYVQPNLRDFVLEPDNLTDQWLSRNRQARRLWNELVRCSIVDVHNAQRNLRQVLKLELKRHQMGRQAEIFTFREHLEWMLGWLS